MTVDRNHVLAALRAKRSEIERQYGVRLVGIVGSVARGEETAESDLDVVVDITGLPSYFGLARAEHDLEEAVGVGLPIELVLREGLQPAFRELMERDLIPL